MKKLCVILAAMALLFSFGCAGPRLKAPKDPSGNRYMIAVLLDKGITDRLSSEQVDQRYQLCNWMEKDLMRMLKKAGYQARRINERSEFSPASGEYLLSVKVINYNPGSKAARLLIGFGAGSTSLDIYYELYGRSPKAILSRDDGVGSSIEWTKVVQKLNQKMVDEVSRTLSH